jgi:hypothetical protein
MSRRFVPSAATVLCLLVFAAPADAIYGPAAGGLGAEIVSVDNASDEQGDAATADAAISADGRYVIFQTKATNFFENDGETQQEREAAEPPGTLRAGGILRYDRITRELALVASGNLVTGEGPEAGKLRVRGAANPSVSAEGRYIAFSTAQRLIPQDKNENVDVYVRDMDLAPGAPGAYKLVSATSGGEEPASYAPRGTPLPGDEPGSEVWPNTAISAEGRYVVFRTTELESNLPDHATVDTLPGQVFIRDLQAKTTTLVSFEKKGEPKEGGPAGGAVGPTSISADGSTVSWVSTNAPAQTRFLPGESLDSSQTYYLWRRWQEPSAATRRVTGIADPEDPECHEGEGVNTTDQIARGPCYGPLTEPESSQAAISGAAPGLSADGYTVAFLASTSLRTDVAKPSSLDVFLTSMRPGVTRKAGTSELTLAASGSGSRALGSIESLAISPDGSTLALTTQRDSFVLPAPAPIGSFRPQPTTRDLYVIHLGANTLERAVLGYESGEPNESVSLEPTLSQDGSTVAFVSSASNLIYGDANGFPDAFAATVHGPGGTGAPPAGVNAGSGGFSLSAIASPELGVSVKRAKDGGVILLVETPGPGKLMARALGSIPKAIAGKTAKKAGASSAAARGSKKSVKKKTAPPVLLASASTAARSEGTTTLTLHLSSRYAKDLRRAGKLKAKVTIDFAPTTASESKLSDEVSATFVTALPAKKSFRKTKAKKV